MFDSLQRWLNWWGQCVCLKLFPYRIDIKLISLVQDNAGAFCTEHPRATPSTTEFAKYPR